MIRRGDEGAKYAISSALIAAGLATPPASCLRETWRSGQLRTFYLRKIVRMRRELRATFTRACVPMWCRLLRWRTPLRHLIRCRVQIPTLRPTLRNSLDINLQRTRLLNLDQTRKLRNPNKTLATNPSQQLLPLKQTLQ